MTILLSNATINNDAPAQTIIGTLSAQDQSGNVIPCNFSLTKGSIGYFAVSGNQLMTAWSSPAAPGFYSVRVHAIGSTMRFSGRATFTIAVAASSPPPPPPPPPSSHAVVIGLAEDAYQGDAQYSLAVDGSVLIPGGTVTVLNSSGTSQDVPISVSDGSHTIVVTFLNDAYGGSPELDRNLYVNYVKYDGVVVPGAQATLLRTGDNFSVTVGSGAAPPPTPQLQPVITVTPSTPQVPDTTPLGAVVATYVVSMSDGTPFSGTVQFGAPNFDGGGVFALSGNNIIVNPNGPGVGPNMTTITDHITLQATA